MEINGHCMQKPLVPPKIMQKRGSLRLFHRYLISCIFLVVISCLGKIMWERLRIQYRYQNPLEITRNPLDDIHGVELTEHGWLIDDLPFLSRYKLISYHVISIMCRYTLYTVYRHDTIIHYIYSNIYAYTYVYIIYCIVYQRLCADYPMNRTILLNPRYLYCFFITPAVSYRVAGTQAVFGAGRVGEPW